MTLYIPLFRSCTTWRSLTQLHAHLLVTGLHADPRASTKLIEAYAQMGSLQSSRLVFETFQKPDSFMWGVLIKCHVWSHCFEKAISLYHNMIYKQAQISSFIFPSVLRASCGFGDVGMGGKVHGRIIRCGFHDDAVVKTSLLCMYGEMGCLSDARKIFDEIPMRDVVSWSSIIWSCVENGETSEGLEMFRLMVAEGVAPDGVTMLGIAEACAELGFLRLARSLHGHMVRKKVHSDTALENSLIVMYSKCGDLCSAERIFVNVKDPSTSAWTAMISCYNRIGCFQEALEVFVEMLGSEVQPNSITLMSVLGSCAGLGWLREGKAAHCYANKRDLDFDADFLGPALIELYVECGKLSDSRKVLHTIGKENIVSWNMIISVYARNGLYNEALVHFVQMQAQGLMPDSFSLASSLPACGSLGLVNLGRQMHGHIIKRGIMDEFVLNSLIDMYSKCGFVDLAYMIFDKIQQKSVVTWNSMVCRYSQSGKSAEAISLFDRMYLNCHEMNQVTFLSIIQACSHLGYLAKGKWIHHKLITCGIMKDIYIDTALTDMYAKGGDLQTAQKIFNSMPERSVVSWSAMISGYGAHGQINAAISLFTQMVESGIRPNEITFMNILSACSHSGSVEEGKYYFDSMRHFGVEPNSEHFACMVDLLSRSGNLDGAYRLINSMPVPADASIWGALLNGCRIHQRMDLIQSIERDLLAISTDDTGYYTLLSNIYAQGGNWIESGKVRSVMEGIGLKKVPGYSTIELDKKVYRFEAGDMSHLQMEEIHSFLENFRSLAQEQFYNVPNGCPSTDTVIFPIGNTVICCSNKHAIEFDIINTSLETTLNYSREPLGL